MKKIYNITISIIVFILILPSCSKFLDVSPEGTLIEDKQFEDIRGFYDAMYGVYGIMGSNKLYGENLTYGFLDRLGGQFCYNNQFRSNDIFIVKYDYLNTKVRATIDEIWATQYKAISYVNNILKNVDQAKFQNKDLQLVKAEALALRAFLHFDMLRLFADNYRLEPNTRGIPYAYTFDLKNKKLFNLEDSYKNIIADLESAEKLLVNDTRVISEIEMTADYHRYRTTHMNLYAVKAELARVYYSMNNPEKAKAYAQQVVDATDNFSLCKSSDYSKVSRFPAKNEMIFGLNNKEFSTNIANMFFSDTYVAVSCTQARHDLEELYDLSNANASSSDVRYSLFYNKYSVEFTGFTRFLKNELEVKDNPVNGFVLISLAEMYYILIETTYTKDSAKAIELLNTFRKSRGLADIDADKVDTKEKLEDELMREKMREFPGMGQIFYALKYYNKDFTQYDKTKITASKKVFVLPWSEKELEYGNQ